MTDHALKAAREIWTKMRHLPITHDATPEIQAIVSQAIQEATGPYRELREAAENVLLVYHNDPCADAECDYCAMRRALLPKETK